MFKPGLLLNNDLARYRYPTFKSSGNAANLPLRIDRWEEMLDSSDQMNTDECTSFAAAGAAEYFRWNRYGIKEQIDPHPIYLHQKKIDGHPDEPGSTLEAAVRALRELDILPVKLDTIKLVHIEDSLRAIQRYGVILGGFLIREGWTNAGVDGWIKPDGEVLGGHAIVLCGYTNRPQDQASRTIQNSWGKLKWGKEGFGRLTPELYARDYVYSVAFDVED